MGDKDPHEDQNFQKAEAHRKTDNLTVTSNTYLWVTCCPEAAATGGRYFATLLCTR